MPCTFDSGAIDWVTPPGTAKSCPLRESRLSRSGLGYRAANGTSIKNHGQKLVKCVNENWKSVGAVMQVADVKKTLAAAIKICQAGNVIMLDSEEGKSYIQNKSSGETTPVHIRGGEFQFDLWIKNDQSVNIVEDTRRVIKEEMKVWFESTIPIANRYDGLTDTGTNAKGMSPFVGQASPY